MVRVSVFLAACVGGALAAPPKGHEVSLDYEYDEFLADFHKAVAAKQAAKGNLVSKTGGKRKKQQSKPDTKA